MPGPWKHIPGNLALFFLNGLPKIPREFPNPSQWPISNYGISRVHNYGGKDLGVNLFGVKSSNYLKGIFLNSM